jgi:hypothetical protein
VLREVLGNGNNKIWIKPRDESSVAQVKYPGSPKRFERCSNEENGTDYCIFTVEDSVWQYIYAPNGRSIDIDGKTFDDVRNISQVPPLKGANTTQAENTCANTTQAENTCPNTTPAENTCDPAVYVVLGILVLVILVLAVIVVFLVYRLCKKTKKCEMKDGHCQTTLPPLSEDKHFHRSNTNQTMIQRGDDSNFNDSFNHENQESASKFESFSLVSEETHQSGMEVTQQPQEDRGLYGTTQQVN